MKKEETYQGVDYSIVLTKNGERTWVTGTQAVTHDDYKREVYVHVCRGYIGANEITSERFRQWDAEEIKKAVGKVEDVVRERIKSRKYEEKHQKRIDETLKELGF